MLTGQRLRNSFAQAMEESEISAMCRADVERLILDKPEVGLQLVHLLSDRLLTYETRLEDMALKEVPTRLASLILLLIESRGVRTLRGYRIPIRYTHQQLATMIGANREAVTRAFAWLWEVGAVETRRRYIHVENLAQALPGGGRAPVPVRGDRAAGWKRPPPTATASSSGTPFRTCCSPWVGSHAFSGHPTRSSPTGEPS